MTPNGFSDGMADSLLRLLSKSVQRSSRAHRQFLRQRHSSLKNMQALIELQITGGQPAAPGIPRFPCLFDNHQLEAFGAGQFSAGLGEAFRKYDGRAIPRIPNGDLRMMSRVTAISGTPRELNRPASVTVEYDVPADAWYFRDNARLEIPYALWMEIALQPCGFLSAYLDTYAFVPYEAFYFRNLDGSAYLRDPGDLRGKMLTTQARLISNVVSGGTVIQRFAFTVMNGEQALFTGESAFGYFAVETMLDQAGLDAGKKILPWIERQPGGVRAGQMITVDRYRSSRSGQGGLSLANGRLSFFDQVLVDLTGGEHGKGYVFASRPVDPQDWYFPYHFSSDPVMPGSLGIEAVLEGVKILALAGGQASRFRSPRFSLAYETNLSWRYRGQITPAHSRMDLEVHLREVNLEGAGLFLHTDASVWVDGLRIYEIKNASIQIVEG